MTHLSILELLEYGFTRKDINRAFAHGVIEFDRPSAISGPELVRKTDVIQHVLETGDYYFGVLSSKVRLTELGLYILELVEPEVQTTEADQEMPQTGQTGPDLGGLSLP
jgi:hypothetical protein